MRPIREFAGRLTNAARLRRQARAMTTTPRTWPAPWARRGSTRRQRDGAGSHHQAVVRRRRLPRHEERELATSGSSGDNNSWGYILGWCRDGSRCDAPTGWLWTGNEDAFGGYDLTDASIDNIARNKTLLMIHSAGNDGGTIGPNAAPFPHNHQDNNGETLQNEIFCYSPSGNGNDCPAPPTCSTGATHCETVRHPPKRSDRVDRPDCQLEERHRRRRGRHRQGHRQLQLRGPHSRRPHQARRRGARRQRLLDLPQQPLRRRAGTSMASPVVTGIAGLLTEQWRKTFNNANPAPVSPENADHRRRRRPRRTRPRLHATASAWPTPRPRSTSILADEGAGKRVRLGLGAGWAGAVPGLGAARPATSASCGWTDPEVLGLGNTDLADKTLVNDLDLTVTDPNGATFSRTC